MKARVTEKIQLQALWIIFIKECVCPEMTFGPTMHILSLHFLSLIGQTHESFASHTHIFFFTVNITLWRKLNRDFLLADRLKSLRLVGNLSGWLATSILRLLHKLLNIPLSPTANNTNGCKEGTLTVYFNGPPKHNSWMLKSVPD